MILKVVFNGELRRVTVADEKISLKKLTKTFKKLFGSALPAAFVLKYTDDEGDLVTVSMEKELSDAMSCCAAIGQTAKFEIFPAPAAPEPPAKPEADPSIDGAVRNLMNSLNLGVDPAKFLSDILPSLLRGLEVEISVNDPRRASSANQESEKKEVEHFASCDSCNTNENIRGNRYKCLSCPDYDLCEACFQKKAHGTEHQFRQITTPACPGFRGFGPRGHPRWDQRPHHGPHHGGPHHGGPHHGHGGHHHGGPHGRGGRRAREEAHASLFEQPAMFCGRQQQSQSVPSVGVVHRAFCDGCKNNQYIQGVRYKCEDAACPDFDLCETCEKKGFEDNVHKNIHQMRCIRNPSDHSRYQNLVRNFMRMPPQACSPAASTTAEAAHAVPVVEEKVTPPVVAEVTPVVDAEPIVSEPAANVKLSTVVSDLAAAALADDSSDDEESASSDSSSEDEEEEEEKVVIVESAEVAAPAAAEENKGLSADSFEPLEAAVAVEVEPAVVAAVAAPQQVSLFESMLNQLAEMGFADREANIALLVKHSGDLLEAVKELLD